MSMYNRYKRKDRTTLDYVLLKAMTLSVPELISVYSKAFDVSLLNQEDILKIFIQDEYVFRMLKLSENDLGLTTMTNYIVSNNTKSSPRVVCVLRDRLNKITKEKTYPKGISAIHRIAEYAPRVYIDYNFNLDLVKKGDAVASLLKATKKSKVTKHFEKMIFQMNDKDLIEYLMSSPQLINETDFDTMFQKLKPKTLMLTLGSKDKISKHKAYKKVTPATLQLLEQEIFTIAISNDKISPILRNALKRFKLAVTQWHNEGFDIYS